jgi:predicted DNA-binding transcriptional regulator AlpA
MKTEFDTQDIESFSDAVAKKLIDLLKPLLPGQAGGLDDLVTVEELSDLLKVKPRQIYALVSESKYSDDGIPYQKLGKKFLRFSRRAVLEWIQGMGKENLDKKEVIKNAGRNIAERKQLLRVPVDRRKEKMVFGRRNLQAKSRNDSP